MTEPMTPEDLEDATRYVAFGESTFDKAFAEERNLPLLRRLLDENARLNAHAQNGWDLAERYVKQLETQSTQWGKTIDQLDEARAERDEAIREAAADKAKLAAVEKAVRDSYPWECDSPTHNTICHLRALTPINIALGYGSEMPRPPAERKANADA